MCCCTFILSFVLCDSSALFPFFVFKIGSREDFAFAMIPSSPTTGDMGLTILELEARLRETTGLHQAQITLKDMWIQELESMPARVRCLEDKVAMLQTECNELNKKLAIYHDRIGGLQASLRDERDISKGLQDQPDQERNDQVDLECHYLRRCRPMGAMLSDPDMVFDSTAEPDMATDPAAEPADPTFEPDIRHAEENQGAGNGYKNRPPKRTRRKSGRPRARYSKRLSSKKGKSHKKKEILIIK
jgi:hypothetical protein